MKRIIFLLAAFISTSTLFAQGYPVFPNGGFENWSGSGTTELPVNYHSNKDGSSTAQMGSQTAFKDASVFHSGSYSVRIETVNYLGFIVVNGSLTTGYVNAPNTSKSNGYIGTTNYDDATQVRRIPFTGRPDSLVGFFKYTQGGAAEAAKVTAILHNNQYYDPETPTTYHPDPTADLIGKATFISAAQNYSGWTRFSVPFNYSSSNFPQYVLINATSSANQNTNTAGSKLWLDDLEFIYNTDVTVSPTADQSIQESQNGAQLTANETNYSADSREWKWITTPGTNYQSFSPSETGTTYTPNFATAGTYYVACVSNFGGVLDTSNEVKIIVNAATVNNVSVAPTADQNLLENQSGTALTATETPSAASSRDWKWTTTSGTNYQSFSPAETGTTYTPDFATAGTYYVACVSDFGGVLDTSNEVKIIVNVATVNNVSVAPTADQNLLENQSGTALTATETPSAASSRAWKWTTTPGTNYQSFSPAETGTTYTPNFATAGTYYVACVSDFSGVKDTSNEVKINVGVNGLQDNAQIDAKIYGLNPVTVDLTNSNMTNPYLNIFGLDGQLIQTIQLTNKINHVKINAPEGIYMYQLSDGQNSLRGKIYLR